MHSTAFVAYLHIELFVTILRMLEPKETNRQSFCLRIFVYNGATVKMCPFRKKKIAVFKENYF